MSKKTKKMVTRSSVVRAFSSPTRSRRETLDIVAKYIGDSPVPPAWTLASVRGVFGNAIARAWARKIRHLRTAFYRDPETGRAVTPVIQTAYDFDTTPEELAKTPPVIGELGALARSGAVGRRSKHGPVIVDEFWSSFDSSRTDHRKAL